MAQHKFLAVKDTATQLSDGGAITASAYAEVSTTTVTLDLGASVGFDDARVLGVEIGEVQPGSADLGEQIVDLLARHRLGLFGAITSKPKEEAAAEIDPLSDLVVRYAERYIEAYSSRGEALAFAYAARQSSDLDARREKAEEYITKACRSEVAATRSGEL